MIDIKIGYYRKEDWEELMEIIDDKESMHSNWYEWFEAFTFTKKQFENNGFKIIEIIVDLAKLTEYCKENGLKNDGATRSQFIQRS